MALWKPRIDAQESQRKVIDLGIMERLQFVQKQQWHELFIAGPTRSVVGTCSNDFPGLYYYDPRDQVEHVLMFDGPVDWTHSKLDRRIEEVGGKSHLLLGLFSEVKLDPKIRLLHSEYKREFFAGQEAGDRDAMPDQWEALEVLTRESFRLLPLQKAGDYYDWQDAAKQCMATLNRERHYRNIGNEKIMLFFETFESDTSTYQLKPSKEYRGTAELVCQAGLASSLLSYASSKPKDVEAFRDLGLSLEKTLSNFYDRETGFFHNTYPPRGEEWTRAVVDTWYCFHNLFHVLRASILAHDQALRHLAHQAVERAIKFVHACDYQVPLFAKLAKTNGQGSVEDAKLIGVAINPSVLGMYAMVLVEASAAYRKDGARYREEALEALRHLRRWPGHQMHHQTAQLSWAAWAAHRLGKRDWRDDFTRCLLLSCYRAGEHSGLFQGCAGLQYPAFLETVDAVTPWMEWIHEIKEPPLSAVLDLVFQKAGRFLSAGAHAGLPQEGLATKEQPQAGGIGVAIYAAPKVFDLAVLQRMLSSNRK